MNPEDQEQVAPGVQPVEGTKRMPYGWVSPLFGPRGWVGAVLLFVTVGIALGLADVNWLWTIVFTAVVLVAVELLRTDAIREHGAIVLTQLRKADWFRDEEWFWGDPEPEEDQR